MISDLLTSSKGPGVIGTLLAIVVLAGFGGLMIIVTDESKGPGINAQIREKEGRIKSLQERSKYWEEAAVQFKQRRDKVREMDSLKSKLSRTKALLEKSKQAVAEQKNETASLAKQFSDYQKQYRVAERARAVGEKMKKLEIKDGKVYEDVSIRKIDALGMNIRHKNGFTRIDYELLPDDIQDRFQFIEADAENLKSQEQAVVEQSVEGKEQFLVSRKILDKKTILKSKNELVAKLEGEVIQSVEQIRSNKTSIIKNRERAAYYRSLPNRGLNWDKAKKHERKVTSLERAVSLAQSRISSNKSQIASTQRQISALKREISSLERDLKELQKKNK